MAFVLSDYGDYGNGTEVFNASNASSFNSYAAITQIQENSITISTTGLVEGAYKNFTVGTEIMVHISALKSGSVSTELGKYFIANITAVTDGDGTKELTLSKSPTSILGVDIISTYRLQAITIPSFSEMTIESGVEIQPTAFNASTFVGGILAFKVNGELKFNGGHIKLTDLGIPTTQKTLRPIQKQEESGTGNLDVELWAGHENWMTKDRFLLNCGDGAAFIIAKTITGSEDSRIGNVQSYGVQFCRGASDSVGGKPASVTNIGGSTILIACNSITNFSPKMISKYRASGSQGGQGLARCYIASKESTLRIDEGLYSFDIVEDLSRVVNELNIRNFGTGSLGDVTNLTTQVNNYAKITAISSDGFRLTYTNKTTNGVAPIAKNATVMIHSIRSIGAATDQTIANIGKFRIANILEDNGTTITLDKYVGDIINPAKYHCQIVSIPQFQNFTLNKTNNATPKYFTQGHGGVFAIAVKGTCNLSDGIINVEARSWSGEEYGFTGLEIIGNAQDSTRIPMGAGNGCALIIANKIVMNSNTRIGGTYSGANFGGAGQDRSATRYPDRATQSGYRGMDFQVVGGSPFYRAQGIRPGGLGGNGMSSIPDRSQNGTNGLQGAHFMIIADTIEGFNLAAISTGGRGSSPVIGYGNQIGTKYYTHGGAGYGGGAQDGGYGASSGGFIGGGGGGDYDAVAGGGGTGFAFIYCNNFINPNLTNITI